MRCWSLVGLIVIAGCGSAPQEQNAEPVAAVAQVSAKQTQKQGRELSDPRGPTPPVEPPLDAGSVDFSAWEWTRRGTMLAEHETIVFDCGDRDRRLLDVRPTEPVPVRRWIGSEKLDTTGNWIADGLGIKWFRNGAVACQSFSQNAKHGYSACWDESGQCVWQRWWRHGDLQGRVQAWYPNGRKKYDWKFDGGKASFGENWDADGKRLAAVEPVVDDNE